MSFSDITFPADYSYASDSNHLPIEFFLQAIPQSSTVELLLGYFSSKAISTLAVGFAPFIYNGGSLRIVTNHHIYKDDFSLIDSEEDSTLEENIVPTDMFRRDIAWLYEVLSNPSQQHFLNCLKYLKTVGQLDIIPVMLKPGKMVHYKQALLTDFEGNSMCVEGSCNFTANGLLENAESVKVFRSWGGDYERASVEAISTRFQPIFNRTSDKYLYLNREDVLDAIETIGKDKTIEELIEDESLIVEELINYEKTDRLLMKHLDALNNMIKSSEAKPRFPFISGPHEYQKEAKESWIRAGKTGIFAMATGTCKTITSLNCLLGEYKETGFYQVLILVPSELLLQQWGLELRRFNFRNMTLVSSKQRGWRREISTLHSDLIFNKIRSFAIVTTYASFTNNVEALSIKLPETCVVIADEAHNIGAPKVRSILNDVRQKMRIGLSATPKREFDDQGNEAVEHFFGSRHPYTYSFPMEKAIREGFLSPYHYYPHIVHLDETEMDDYREISTKLAKLFHGNREDFNGNEAVKSLLLKRKRIIHKASAKLPAFKLVISQEYRKKSSLEYAFVYVPEGADETDTAMIDSYIAAANEVLPSLRAAAYTQSTENKKEILSNFENGYIEMLFAMKCLDEGVDIPRTELAVFCSSTGTPRQFVQRRGRILRTHKDKKSATIHDLVVFPAFEDGLENNLEKRFIKSELTRVVEFAKLAKNYSEAMNECNEAANQFGVDVYALEYELDNYELEIYGSPDSMEESG